MGRFCIICGGGSDRSTTLFSVPKDEESRLEWQSASGKILKTGSFVCSKHFLPKYLVRRRLKTGALPSVSFQPPDDKIQNINLQGVIRQKYQRICGIDNFSQSKQLDVNKIFIKTEEPHEDKINSSDSSNLTAINSIKLRESVTSIDKQYQWENPVEVCIDSVSFDLQEINVFDTPEVTHKRGDVINQGYDWSHGDHLENPKHSASSDIQPINSIKQAEQSVCIKAEEHEKGYVLDTSTVMTQNSLKHEEAVSIKQKEQELGCTSNLGHYQYVPTNSELNAGQINVSDASTVMTKDLIKQEEETIVSIKPEAHEVEYVSNLEDHQYVSMNAANLYVGQIDVSDTSTVIAKNSIKQEEAVPIKQEEHEVGYPSNLDHQYFSMSCNDLHVGQINFLDASPVTKNFIKQEEGDLIKQEEHEVGYAASLEDHQYFSMNSALLELGQINVWDTSSLTTENLMKSEEAVFIKQEEHELSFEC